VRALPGLPQYLLKRRLIRRLFKNLCAPNRAIENVIDLASIPASRPPGHGDESNTALWLTPIDNLT